MDANQFSSTGFENNALPLSGGITPGGERSFDKQDASIRYRISGSASIEDLQDEFYFLFLGPATWALRSFDFIDEFSSTRKTRIGTLSAQEPIVTSMDEAGDPVWAKLHFVEKEFAEDFRRFVATTAIIDHGLRWYAELCVVPIEIEDFLAVARGGGLADERPFVKVDAVTVSCGECRSNYLSTGYRPRVIWQSPEKAVADRAEILFDSPETFT